MFDGFKSPWAVARLARYLSPYRRMSDDPETSSSRQPSQPTHLCDVPKDVNNLFHMNRVFVGPLPQVDPVHKWGLNVTATHVSTLNTVSDTATADVHISTIQKQCLGNDEVVMPEGCYGNLVPHFDLVCDRHTFQPNQVPIVGILPFSHFDASKKKLVPACFEHSA